MVQVHPELVMGEMVAPDYDALPPVRQHVTALGNYVSRLAEVGELSPEAASFARMFAGQHDVGYCTPIDALQTPEALAILGGALEAVESPAGPREVADYLQRYQDKYLAARVIGHGVLGLVENTRYFQEERGLSRRKALGLAAILAAHHPGYPITMVAGFFKKGAEAVPDNLRTALFIDDNGENPEVVRRRLAEFAASHLGISTHEAHRAVALGYALDRLTAGSVPDKLELNNGTVEVYGGEVTDKKYGLVAGDLMREHGLNTPIRQLFFTVHDRVKNENEAAMAAARAASAPDIHDFVKKQRAYIEGRLHHAQGGAVSAMTRFNLAGIFSNLEVEREVLAFYADYEKDHSDLLYTLDTYDKVIAEMAKHRKA